MTNLSTQYMGLPLKNPVIVGACSLSKRIDGVRRVEDSGAAALVIKSLFEEQIMLESDAFDGARERHEVDFAEAASMFPALEHAGPKEHVFWVSQVRKAVKIPLFASLNCVNVSTWAQYAKMLEDTGIDGLELNFYSPALDAQVTAAEIEKREIDTLASVRAAVKIPIAVKLHPFYTSLMHVTAGFEGAGANGFVLFNRLFQPDIDVDAEAKAASPDLFGPRDSLVPLRWTALLSPRLRGDIAASTGIKSGRDVAKMILAGARAVQIVSVLYREKTSHVQTMLSELSSWMAQHGHGDIESFRGKLAREKGSKAWSFERGQYVKAVVGID